MIAEIITVGTEILMGQIVNTNTRYISGRLADFGVNLYYHVTVGDNRSRLTETIKNGLERSDILIFTGGLGPTEDDITKETVAEVFGLELKLNEECKAVLEKRLLGFGRTITPNNYKQVMFPETNCIILPNPNGTAPGCIMEKNGKAAILLPGPPWEMEPMFENSVVPYLQKLSDCIFHSRTMRIFGMGESQVETAIKHIVDAQTNPTIAPYAKASETTLRLTAKCQSADEGEALIKPVMDAINEIIGEFVYSTHGKDMHEVCAALLEKSNLKLAVAESCTGGLIASRLISVPGSSNWLIEGAVTYSCDAKMRRLGVKSETLEKHTAVSRETAAEMAEGIRFASGADIGISTTGYAGPGGDPEEVGKVFIGISSKHGTDVHEFKFRGDRDKIRNTATLNALNLVRKFILENACKIDSYML